MEFSADMKATQLLGEEHHRLQERYRALLEEQDPGQRAAAAEPLLGELERHSCLEERLVYPELARRGLDQDLVRHFGQEHGELRRLISDFRLAREEEDRALSPQCLMLLSRIMACVQRHVVEEEARAFPALEASPAANAELGAALAALRLKLKTFPPIQRRLELAVPARLAYDQWTRFEAFPCFLDSVTGVRQLDDAHVQWQVAMGGKDVQWTAEIYEQIPDRRIAWISLDGAPNTGSVSFLPLNSGATRMLVEITYEPQGLLEDLGALVGVLATRVTNDLNKFKAFIETRAPEAEGWRGRIEGTPVDPQVRRPEERPS